MPGTETWGVVLRPPRALDVEAFEAFGVSEEIRRMYGGDPDRIPRMDRGRAERWFEGMVAHPCAWVIDADDQPVGQARLDAIDRADRRARLALGLFGDGLLGRGIGRIAVRMVLDHAFDVLELHRVDLRVLAFNRRAIRCYLACGFVHEGTEREAARVGRGWHDDWIMGILSHEHAARRG